LSTFFVVFLNAIDCRPIAYLRVVGGGGEAKVVEHQPSVFAQHCSLAGSGCPAGSSDMTRLTYPLLNMTLKEQADVPANS
jgi:hypothetical protein